MSKTVKKNRSANWTEEEKQLLRTVLKDYASIIEDKSLKTNNNNKKLKAWQEVHLKFNQLNDRPRDLPQLKIQWKTMKTWVRKEHGHYKKEQKKTGGGSRPPTPDTEIFEIKDLLNPGELMVDHNIYDSDGIELKEIKTPVTSIKVLTELEPEVKTVDQMIEEFEEQHQQPDSQEPTPEPPVSHCYSPVTVTPQIDKKLSGKIVKKCLKLNSIKKQSSKQTEKSSEQHQDYLTTMVSHSRTLKDEEHNKRMQMAEEEHQRRMEMAEEKHNIEMQIKNHELKRAIIEQETSEIKKDHLLQL